MSQKYHFIHFCQFLNKSIFVQAKKQKVFLNFLIYTLKSPIIQYKIYLKQVFNKNLIPQTLLQQANILPLIFSLRVYYKNQIRMEAVGNEVIVALILMASPIVLIVIYYWNNIKEFYLSQIAGPEVPVQQPHDRQQIRRQRNDNTCSICLNEPKRFQISSSCGHSFCGTCLLEIYNRSTGFKIKCPLCRNDISVMFKCFHDEEPRDIGNDITNQIRQYNMLFDDNRPLLRRILQFPYIIKRLISQILSFRFLIYFLRHAYFIRLIFLVLFYVILPFDILPERFVGIVGFIDDLFVIIIVTTYIASIVAVQYYRNHH